jgi:hypothetical protein
VRRALSAGKRDRRRVAAATLRLREARSDGRLRGLCTELVRRFGGISGFMDTWTASIGRDLQRGGYAAFRHIECVLKLTQYCERNRPDFSRFTDDELAEAVRALGGEFPSE